MILVDANILLYAYNPSFHRHRDARGWLEQRLSNPEPVGLSWSAILAFLRIGTNPRAFEYPLSIEEAVGHVSSWLDQPMLVVLEPGDRHWTILSHLLSQSQVRGPAVMDAHVAALAIEHGAILCTSDRGFARFPDLKMLNPFDAAS